MAKKWKVLKNFSGNGVNKERDAFLDEKEASMLGPEIMKDFLLRDYLQEISEPEKKLDPPAKGNKPSA